MTYLCFGPASTGSVLTNTINMSSYKLSNTHSSYISFLRQLQEAVLLLRLVSEHVFAEGPVSLPQLFFFTLSS